MESSKKETDIDTCLEQCGSFGRYQLYLQLLFMVFVLCFGCIPYLPYFILHDPPWTCRTPANTTLANTTTNEFCRNHRGEEIASYNKDFHKRCEMKESEWTSTKDMHYSIVTEFQLNCGRSSLADMTTTLFFVGAVISAIVSGKCADTFGRKITMTVLLTLTVVGSVGCFFVSQLWQLYVLRVIYGMGQPLYNVALIYLMELMPAKHQSLSGLLYQSPYCFSVLCLDGVGYLVRQWRSLQLYVSLPLCVLFIPFVFLLESPRWLLANGKLHSAENKLKKIAQFNGVNGKSFTLKLCLPENHAPVTEGSRKYTYLDLLKNRKVAFVVGSQAFMWFTTALLYYMLGLESSRLGGNIYEVFALSTLFEIPGSFAAIYLCNRYGRKKTILTCFLLSGLLTGAIATVPVSYPRRHVVNISLALLAKFFVNIAYCALYVWSFELIPTVVRSQGMLLFSVLENSAGLFVPFLVGALQNAMYVLPFIIASVVTLLAAVLGTRLPETNNRPTREVFDDFFEPGNKVDPRDVPLEITM